MTDFSSIWDKLEAIIKANRVVDDLLLSNLGVAEVLADYGSPSTSVAILEHGKISARCYSRVSDDSETVFQACSISKPVAGLAVMKLVSEGKLSLAAPIRSYLPDGVIQNLSPSQEDLLQHVTIKHLLSHTSGLSVHGFAGYAQDDIPDARRVLSGRPPTNSLQVRLEGLPGLRFAYSGGGFTVLQLILEHVTGKPFPDLIQELVLTPLDMKRSFYHKPSEKDNHASTYYTGYQACEDPFHVHPEQAAAGLWTTPTDLLKVVRTLQRSLISTDDSSFLGQDLARLMLDEVSDGMALSWFAPRDPGTAFQHGGSNFGFRCHVLGYANLGSAKMSDERLAAANESGICIMTNSEQGDTVVRKIFNAIAYLRGWPTMPLVYGLNSAVIPFRAVDVAVSPEHWKRWEGRWGTDWEIVDEKGDPYVRFQKLPLVRLHSAARPSGPREDGDVPIDFVISGLEMMLRLTRLDGELVVEVWHGPKGDIKVVRRG